MTKDSARKRAISDFMAANPRVSRRDAAKFVAARHAAARRYAAVAATFTPVERLVAGALDGELLFDHQLHQAGDDDRHRHSFVVAIPDVEGLVDVWGVELDPATVDVDEHETFDGGTTVGEARIEADVEWSGSVYIADYYGAGDDSPWRVVGTPDVDADYVEVCGTLRARLTYQFQVTADTGTVEDISLVELEQLALMPA